MKYLSVCSGIEAATVAWHPLGWKPLAFSEIEKFPSRVLAHHYPNVPNLGDMTKYQEWNLGTIDLLVGGTPCQSFSVAGLRKGLEDPRGNLMLTFLAIAQRYGPQWIIWENVPGVLSSNAGRDFGTFLSALGRLGYGFAYRVLDAQWFGVAQRRRRVFVVGYFGDWRSAAKVLFEYESVSRNPAPSREKRQEVAGTFKARAKSGGWGQDVDLAASGYMRVTPTLTKECTGVSRPGHNEEGWYVTTHRMVAFGEYADDGTASSMKARYYKDATDLVAQPTSIAKDMAVRRLTPVECERLQGFPDNYTNIPNAADGPRYKALGNSMAVPVMRWIGKRIDELSAGVND
jgi:DNA (cytosine-5)-methyltransferase 1